jgi:hypothetical protein
MLSDLIKLSLEEAIVASPQIEPWLGNWTPHHETQINLDPTGLIDYGVYVGEPGKHKGWWWPEYNCRVNHIRIPYDANTEPQWNDRKPTCPIHEKFQFIGTSGWNWVEKQSEWVGFDIDSEKGHKSGLTDEQIAEATRRALELPYVVARTSKGGHGIHLLVYLDPKPTTRNHDEHAAVSEYVLSRMSSDCGFDFTNVVDCYGRILFHWEKGLKDGCCQRITNA